MSGTERCDKILQLIDEVLAERAAHLPVPAVPATVEPGRRP
jgi:hypothetical protein